MQNNNVPIVSYIRNHVVLVGTYTAARRNIITGSLNPACISGSIGSLDFHCVLLALVCRKGRMPGRDDSKITYV